MTTHADDLAFQTRVDGSLQAFILAKRQQLAELGPDIAMLLDSAAASIAGGKRIRSAFCYAGWCAGGGDPRDERIATAAASFEWLQASALVHDDLMDGSETRRGRPSAHRAFENQHRASDAYGDREGFGSGAAILLGDLLLSWTDEMLRTSAFDPAVTGRAFGYLDACKTEVVAGQFLDVLGQTRAQTSVAEAMRIVRYKSAKYTVERPLHVGAALAGASEDTIGRLTAFAVPAGEAFQLRDDILGVFGNPAVTGKPAGDDLREGKRTVLVARTYALSNAAGRELLNRGLGNTDHIVELTELIESTGALEAVETQIGRLEEEATAAITNIGVGAERLTELLAQSVRRIR